VTGNKKLSGNLNYYTDVGGGGGVIINTQCRGIKLLVWYKFAVSIYSLPLAYKILPTFIRNIKAYFERKVNPLRK
jgi:hypothetical protein